MAGCKMSSAAVAHAPNISEIEESEEARKLSPYAPEFHPTSAQQPDLHLCIFNDGVPSLVLASEADVSNLLHDITDEAIDEGFPPTAEEAAELELVEQFVEMMASLAYMEEREERARISFDHVKKRWESRRAEGLVGRPRPPKHSVEPNVHGGQPNIQGSNSKAVVHYDQHAHRMLMKHQKLHQKDLDMRAKHMAATNKRSSGGGKQRNPIQQPRKAN